MNRKLHFRSASNNDINVERSCHGSCVYVYSVSRHAYSETVEVNYCFPQIYIYIYIYQPSLAQQEQHHCFNWIRGHSSRRCVFEYRSIIILLILSRGESKLCAINIKLYHVHAYPRVKNKYMYIRTMHARVCVRVYYLYSIVARKHASYPRLITSTCCKLVSF